MHPKTQCVDKRNQLSSVLQQNPLKLIAYAFCHRKAYQFKQKYNIGRRITAKQQSLKKGSIGGFVAKKGIGRYINSCIEKKCFLPEEGRRLVVKAVRKGGIKDGEVRKRIWLLLTETYSNIKLYKDYYSNLKKEELLDVESLSKMNKGERREVVIGVLKCYQKRNPEFGVTDKTFKIGLFLVKLGFSEEEVFWMLVYILETAMPKLYLFNKYLSVLDAKLLKVMLKQLYPSLLRHLNGHEFEIDLLLENWFSGFLIDTNNFKVD